MGVLASGDVQVMNEEVVSSARRFVHPSVQQESRELAQRERAYRVPRGFYTEDIFENRKRVGYVTKTLQGESRILARSGV